MKRLMLPLFVALTAPSAANAELRALCASRPGLGTPPCTVDPGHVVVEVGVADWTLDDSDDTRTDTVIAGDFAVRVGLDDTTEVQVGWTPYGHVRVRDKATGLAARTAGTGDVTIALRHGVSGPDGKIAIQPFVTLPVGGRAIGAGDWGAGVIMPIAFDLGNDVQLALSPEVDAAVNESGSGRHIAYGSVIGLSVPLSKALTGNVEVQAVRDDDPDGKTTQTLASISLAAVLGTDTQLDVGAVAGLNRNSPDVQVYFGIARRF